MKILNLIKHHKRKSGPIKLDHLVKHETKQSALIKFILLVLVVGIYTGFLSWKYGFATGGFLAVLTWSFFVLCTPIADAGFLLDFPLRLLLGLRMKVTEMFVWLIAISLNIYAILFHATAYDQLFITRLLKQILTHPYPYWLIIILSAVGTFMSVIFGDELMDLIKHKDREMHHKHSWKLELIGMISVFTITILAYDFLLHELGIKLSDFA